jgi:hypothetical protein
MLSNPLVGETLVETMGAAGAGVSLCAGRNLYSLTNRLEGTGASAFDAAVKGCVEAGETIASAASESLRAIFGEYVG